MSTSNIQTVLFADISGSTRLYEDMGDRAAKAIIEQCLNLLIAAVDAYQGRLIKCIGDEIMATFPEVDACVFASCRMQEVLSEFAKTNQLRVGLRVGLNYGPIILDADDIFGNTVNIAAHMIKRAQPRQIITNTATVEELSPLLRARAVWVENVCLAGQTESVNLYRLNWEEATSIRLMQRMRDGLSRKGTLNLEFHDEVMCLPPAQGSFSIGRNPDNDLTIQDDYTSRNHVQIIYRKGKYVLIDQSTNGTFIVLPDGTNTLIHREEYVLQQKGWIGIGELRYPDHPDVIRFEVSDDMDSTP
jgi:class 3 adenylate cyclase